MKFFWLCVAFSLFLLSGCVTTNSTQEAAKVSLVEETESGFEKYIDEFCPDLEENTANGLDCAGQSFTNEGSVETGDFEYYEYEAGVEDACTILFSISPDGNLFAGENRIEEDDCYGWGGDYDGSDSDIYAEGYYDTIEFMFADTPYWCWGTECVTPDDF